MAPRPATSAVLELDQLAQLVEAHGFTVVTLGNQMFVAEKYSGRGRIRMITIRWNTAQNAWTGKLQTLERLVSLEPRRPDSSAAPYWRPRERHPGVAVLWDFMGARDWLAKVEREASL
jgi:hypothetical protein